MLAAHTKKDRFCTATFTLHTGCAGRFHMRKIEGGNEICPLILWHFNIEKILNGLNINAHGPAMPIVEATCQFGVNKAKEAHMVTRVVAVPNAGAANVIRGVGIHHASNIICNHAKKGQHCVLTKVMPRRVLTRVKRQSQRDAHKPKGMKVNTCACSAAILWQNMECIPNLPPFYPNQLLPNDKLFDIVLFGTLNSWWHETECQGFDPIGKSLDRVVA